MSDKLKILNLDDSVQLTKEVFFEQSFVLLPKWISAQIDRANLSIAIKIPPERMSIVNLSDESRPLSISPATYAFYWNYDLALSHQILTKRAQIMTAHRPIFTSPYGSLSNQFISRSGESNNFVRLETAYLFDLPRYQMRFIAGDFATDTPSFISSVAAAGIKFSKGFLFHTGSLSYPAMSLSGFSPRPGDVEVWINDILNSKKDIPMGGFVLDNVKLPAGAADGKLVIKDAKGIVSSIPFSYYGDPEILRPGFTSYSYSAGFMRKDYGLNSFSYGAPAFFGSHNIGITNFWTTSFHAQASPKSGLFGLEQRFRLFNFGSTAIATAATLSSRSFGFLVAPQLQLDFLHTKFKTRAILSSADYLPVSLSENRGKHLSLMSSLNFDLPYIKYSTINYLLMLNKEDNKHAIGIRQQIPIHRDLNINLGANYDLYHNNFGGFIFLSYQLFDRHIMSIDADHSYGRSQASTDFTGNIGANKNYNLSYGLGALVNKNPQGRGNMNFENRYLRSRFQVLGSNKNLEYMAGFASSFGIMRNRFFISQPVEQGITLIELPGENKVQVYQNNTSQLLGKTDSDGFLFIPNLMPYQDTQLNIDLKDISHFSDYEEYSNDIKLTPGFQTAHRIKLTSKKVRHLHFYLREGQKSLPPGTGITINGLEKQSFVMSDGSVYLDVPEDKIILRGQDESERCQFSLRLPKRTEAIIEEIGNVSCEAVN